MAKGHNVERVENLDDLEREDGDYYVDVPANDWNPRSYQQGTWDALEGGCKRVLDVCHRRWGKDDVALNWAACAAHDRPGTYWHMLPEASQARKAIWDAVDEETGVRRIDQAFPHELRETTKENEMFIRFKCGSTWQVVGSDNFNSLVGSPPVGCTFSEYAIGDPAGWSYIRPVLARNGGWALFLFTPRGHNHGENLYKLARNDPWDPVTNPKGWYAARQTALETGVFDKETLEQELRELIAEHGRDDGLALFQQEYMVSFDAAVIGSYYRHEFSEIDAEERVTRVPHDRAKRVWTAWDLGKGDSTAIWFVQLDGGEVRVIDYYRASGVGIDHYAKVLEGSIEGGEHRRNYLYERHIFPHDMARGDFGIVGGKSRERVMRELLGDVVAFTVLPLLPIDDGIQAARRLLSRCVFDAKRCDEGLSALRSYQKLWNTKHRRFEPTPLHNWASDGADAFRYLALGLPDKLTRANANERPKYGRTLGGRRPHKSGRKGGGKGWGAHYAPARPWRSNPAWRAAMAHERNRA